MAHHDGRVGEHEQADPSQRGGARVPRAGPPHLAHGRAEEGKEGLPGGPLQDQLTVHAGM